MAVKVIDLVGDEPDRDGAETLFAELPFEDGEEADALSELTGGRVRADRPRFEELGLLLREVR